MFFAIFGSPSLQRKRDFKQSPINNERDGSLPCFFAEPHEK